MVSVLNLLNEVSEKHKGLSGCDREQVVSLGQVLMERQVIEANKIDVNQELPLLSVS